MYQDAKYVIITKGSEQNTSSHISQGTSRKRYMMMLDVVLNTPQVRNIPGL